jgi:hypothetical protein
MPGINQLGGALSVNPTQRDAGGGEAQNARPTDSKKSPEPTPADAVKGAAEAKATRGQTMDEAERPAKKRPRKFSQLQSRGRADPKTGDNVNITAEKRTDAAKKARARMKAEMKDNPAEAARAEQETAKRRAEDFDENLAPKSERHKATLAKAMGDLHAVRPRPPR